MTDRYSGLTVTFDRNMRDDDSQQIISAIRLIKGVVGVDPITSDWSPETIRVRNKIGRKVHELALQIIHDDIDD